MQAGGTDSASGDTPRALASEAVKSAFGVLAPVSADTMGRRQGNQFSRIVQISEGFRRQLNIICERGRLEFKSVLNRLIRFRANFLRDPIKIRVNDKL